MTADYIDRQPVPFRKKIVNDLLKELEEHSDGSKLIKNSKSGN